MDENRNFRNRRNMGIDRRSTMKRIEETGDPVCHDTLRATIATVCRNLNRSTQSFHFPRICQDGSNRELLTELYRRRSVTRFYNTHFWTFLLHIMSCLGRRATAVSANLSVKLPRILVANKHRFWANFQIVFFPQSFVTVLHSRQIRQC